jgi:protein O-GlcNAc transferase
LRALKDRFREATTLHRAGALEQAEAIYRDLLREDPERANAWHRLGLVLHARREFSEAIEHIEKALAISKTNPVHWNNYGAVLKDSGQQLQAKEAFEKAVGLNGDYADAWSNLGLMQAELGELDEAENSIRYALRLHPQHPDALRHLAVISQERGNLEEALRLCQDAAAMAPAKAEVYKVAGNVLGAMKRFDEAAAAHEKARHCSPTAVDIQLNLGFAYTNLDESEKARESFQVAAQMRPDLPVWQLRHLGLCPTVFQTANEVDEYRTDVERQLDEALANPPPFDWRTAPRDGFAPSFQLSHHGVCNRRLKERYARLFASHFPQERPQLKQRNKIRVAFTCTRGHEGGFIRGFGGVMERLDRNRFDVFGLVSQSILAQCRQRVQADDVAWIGFPHHMETALQRFQQAECDVVMHWHAGTDIMNYFLPFLPLAPVQCIGFGTHGTTGISNIDHFISSRLFERGDEADNDYAERLVQFNGTTAWQPRPPNPLPTKRSDFGLPETGTLYFCPQRHAKLHPDFDRILQGILAQDTSGHLVIMRGDRPNTAAKLNARFARTVGEKIAGRILFVSSQGTEEYYRLLSLMDIVLDTPVYSASLTGYDAFAYGIPVVTIPGKYMVQRYAAGLYERMGVEGPVADNEEDYVRLAVRLGTDADALRHMRREIRERSDVLFQDVSVIQEYNNYFWNVTR